MTRETETLLYDRTVSKTVCEETIRYGILFGNEKFVFIKVGADGTVRGYRDKYLKISHRIRERMEATVICASNPNIENGHIDADRKMIIDLATEMNLSEFEVYFFGISDGAYHNLVLAKEVPETVKILGVNTSTFDFCDLKERLFELPCVNKILVYGTKDDEYRFVPDLKQISCDRLEILAVEGADHEFKGMLEEFIALADLL